MPIALHVPHTPHREAQVPLQRVLPTKMSRAPTHHLPPIKHHHLPTPFPQQLSPPLRLYRYTAAQIRPHGVPGVCSHVPLKIARVFEALPAAGRAATVVYACRVVQGVVEIPDAGRASGCRHDRDGVAWVEV